MNDNFFDLFEQLSGVKKRYSTAVNELGNQVFDFIQYFMFQKKCREYFFVLDEQKYFIDAYDYHIKIYKMNPLFYLFTQKQLVADFWQTSKKYDFQSACYDVESAIKILDYLYTSTKPLIEDDIKTMKENYKKIKKTAADIKNEAYVDEIL